MVCHTRRPPCPGTQQNTVALPLRTRPTNFNKLHYTTLGQTKTQLTSTDTDVPATQTGFGDTTTGSRATEHTQTKPTMRQPRQPRTPHNTAAAATCRNGNGVKRVGDTVVRHARRRSYSRTKIVTLPSRNRPTNINKLRRTVKRPTNQPRRLTSNSRPPGRGQARPSQEA